MGTAFGLDASLMASEHLPEDQGPESSVNAGWERRLVRRGRR
jgi:hypothetical protein